MQVVDDTVIAAEACKIVIPFSYLSNRLATISEDISILAVAAVVSGDEYGVLNGCCQLKITPSQTKQVMMGGTEYMEFYFEKGDTMIPSLLSVKDSDLVADIYGQFYSRGRVPDYLDGDDVGLLLQYHNQFGGLKIASANTPFEVVTAMISRDHKDKFKYWRHGDMKFTPIVVPFSSVIFNARSTTAKLLGSNLKDGFTSALVNPSEKSEKVENMLRY